MAETIYRLDKADLSIAPMDERKVRWNLHHFYQDIDFAISSLKEGQTLQTPAAYYSTERSKLETTNKNNPQTRSE